MLPATNGAVTVYIPSQVIRKHVDLSELRITGYHAKVPYFQRLFRVSWRLRFYNEAYFV